MSADRHPRTLQQAFGPHTSRDVHPMPESRTERIAGVLVAVVVGVLGALAIVHWAAGG